MNTLVLKSRNVISNPAYGKITDLNDGLRVLLDARGLAQTQNQTVSAWVATGSGSALERTYDKLTGSWVAPTLDEGTFKSVRFDGNNMLRTDVNTARIVTKASYIIVFKVDEVPTGEASGGSRIFTGARRPSNDSYHSLTPQNGGLTMRGYEDTSDGAVIPTNSAEWTVGVFVFDGANSKCITSANNSIVSNARNESAVSRISLGSNPAVSSPAGEGFKGNIALFAQYDKAFTDDEILKLFSYYRGEFNI